MNDYRKHVEAAIQATVFYSPTSYSWFGKQSWSLTPTIKRALTPQTARNYLLFNLQSQLYTDFYCPGLAMPTAWETAIHPVTGMTPLVEALSAANSGNGYWDDGWEVRTIEGDKVVVHRGGLELWVRPEDCLVIQSTKIVPGMQLSLRFPKELLSISPGFYLALSDKALTQEDTQGLVRFYWNLSVEGAVRFMRDATAMLNQANLPFKLKILNNPNLFTRCDTVVLYIQGSDYAAVSEILSTIYPAFATSLRQRTPVFTKRLAPGLGLAEDPGQEESFGGHRCQILAEGMIRAYEQGKKSLDERLQVVEDCFAEAGITLDKPFLNPGSSDCYHFQPRPEQQLQLRRGTVPALHADSSTALFLRTAHQIGQQLSQEAIWYQDCCNWLGAEPQMRSSARGLPAMTYKALGPTLYDGTSGVALFLAELYAVTGDAATRRTALGAIGQALSHADSVPPSSRLGLYSGWMGIALAAARIGIVLGEEELLCQATQLLERSMCENQDQHEFDLISGSAGAIAALVVLRDMLNHPSLLDFAVRLGDELLQTADRSDAGYSWKSFAFPKQRGLTGFSHGTAGVGYALLELFRAAGDSRYRSTAEFAFNYERHWFDADAGNWPDFREELMQGKRSKRPLSFATFWCHGAPGIALSRLRAYRILNDETCKAEAMTALQTTHEMIEIALHAGMENFSLCHGLAGNADVLLEGFEALGQEWTKAHLLALEVAKFGIETYVLPGLEWPCGTHGGKAPGMLLGLAGIGHFYLHLYSPTTPSILILQREKFLTGCHTTKRPQAV